MTRRLTVLTIPALLAMPVAAHEGHGLPGAHHWHATDVLGFIAAAIAIGVAIWWARRK